MHIESPKAFGNIGIRMSAIELIPVFLCLASRVMPFGSPLINAVRSLVSCDTGIIHRPESDIIKRFKVERDGSAFEKSENRS
jgi:hypothetical protein